MKLRNILFYTGAWICIPLEFLMFYGARQLNFPGHINKLICSVLLAVPIWAMLMITAGNYKRAKRGHTDFTFQDAIGHGKREIHEGKAAREAMYPPIPVKYLSRMPKDLVLGRWNGRYVHCPLGEDGVMAFVIGAPGAHKTVLLLSWLYTVYYRKRIYGKQLNNSGAAWNYVLIDVKGEVYQKLIKIKGIYRATGKERLQVFQPGNRLSYGWDVFYQLRGKNVTETIRLKAVQDIADALIEESKGEKNPFFPKNAKKILVGILFFYSGQGKDFIEIMVIINETPADDLLAGIVKEARIQNDRITLGMLAEFVGKKDVESINDVIATMKTDLQCFLFPDLVYALQNNPHRTSPRVLNTGKISIDIAIEEAFLSVYRPVFRLLCVQILRHCASEFREDDNRITSIILDEASRIKRVPELEEVMATCRSKHVNVLLIFQNRNQFDGIYGREVSESILNLCELKLFLSSGGDRNTVEYIQSMAGKYIDRKKSINKEGFSIKSTSISEEEKQIVDGRELMALREKKEMIAFIYGQYFRFPKIMYYKDPYIAPIAQEIKEFNNKYKYIGGESDGKATKKPRGTNYRRAATKTKRNCKDQCSNHQKNGKEKCKTTKKKN